jgi:hypothetical protein
MPEVRRRIRFDGKKFAALDRLARDRMSNIQELADEAFRDERRLDQSDCVFTLPAVTHALD